MKKAILFSIFITALCSPCFAQSNYTESLTITTYYPSPYGVYRNLKLNPTAEEPSGPALSRGVMYYNDSENVIKYRNNETWVDIGKVNAISDDKPADVAGAVYYDTSNSSIKYYNGTSWADIGGSNATGGVAGGWEHNTTTGHVYNVNTGNIGIGTRNPQEKLHIVGREDGTFPAQDLVFIEGEGTVSTVLFSSSNTATHDTKLEPYRARGRMSNRSPLNLDDYIFTLDPAGYTGGAQNYHAAGRIRFLADGSFSSASAPGRIEFHTTPISSLLPVNRMVIKNNGNVGLGMENPQAPLHIETPLLSGFVIKNGKGNPDVTLRSGAMSLMPWRDSFYIATNCYYRDGTWVQDAWSGSATRNGKLLLDAADGAYWSASTNVPVTGFWDISDVPLWDGRGILAGPSSRKAKENFTRLNPDEILQQIDQLEVSRWNYKVDDKSVTHIGPVAEDFHRIFKTGDSEKSIALIDSSGVSLAGVKALLEKVTMQQQQIEKFQAEMEELKSRLSK